MNSVLTSYVNPGDSGSRIYFTQYNYAGNTVMEAAWHPDEGTRNAPGFAGYSETDLTSKTGASAPKQGTPLVCYNVDPGSRVYYVTPDGHVHEFAWNNGWGEKDLFPSISPQPPKASADSAITGWPNHVYYCDESNHVQELAWTGDWANSHLTLDAGAPPAHPGTALAAVNVNGNTRVYYVSSGAVHELAWNNGWKDSAISPGAASGRALVAFTVANWGLRVYYFDTANHLHELKNDNGSWVDTDILDSASPRPADADSASAMAGYGNSDWTSHLYYYDVHSHIIEISWQGYWAAIDITAAAHAPSPTSLGALTCVGIGGNSHVFYAAFEANASPPANIIQELAWGNGWTLNPGGNV